MLENIFPLVTDVKLPKLQWFQDIRSAYSEQMYQVLFTIDRTISRTAFILDVACSP